MPYRILAAIGVILAVLLCTAPTWAEEKQACDFLTVEEVSQVMGTPVSPPEAKPANPMGQTICFFDAPKAGGVTFAQLQLVTASSPKLKKLGFTAAGLFKNNTGFLDNPKKIDGVGQEALWGGSGMKMGAGLHVLCPGAYFTVIAQAGDEEACLEKSKQLAALVIAKVK